MNFKSIKSNVKERTVTFVVNDNFDEYLELLKDSTGFRFFKDKGEFPTHFNFITPEGEVSNHYFAEDIDLDFIEDWTQSYKVKLKHENKIEIVAEITMGINKDYISRI